MGKEDETVLTGGLDGVVVLQQPGDILVVHVMQAIDVVIGANVASVLTGPEDFIVQALVANRFVTVHSNG